MQIPPLFSVQTPLAPQWCPVVVNQGEYLGLRRSVALIVGYDTNAGVIRPLGSGFIFSPIPHALQIVTAAHVVFGFVNQFLGPAPRTGLSLAGTDFEVEAKRLDKVFSSGKIKAVIEVASSGQTIVVDLASYHVGTDERLNDIAVLQMRHYPALDHAVFLPMMLDFAPVNTTSEPHVMAGFANMPELRIGEESRVAEMRQHLVLRAAPVVEITTNAPGARPGALRMRVPMPSEPGMSGGPLLRVRRPRGRPMLIGQAAPELYTAVGLVSAGPLGGMFAGYQCPEGETWITPIELLNFIQADPYISFRDVIDLQVITYQDVEPRLANLPANADRGPNLLTLELLKEKIMRASRPVIDAYRALMPSIASGAVVSTSGLPYHKGRFRHFLAHAIMATERGQERDFLEAAYRSLSRWQAGFGTLSNSEIQERARLEMEALSVEIAFGIPGMIESIPTKQLDKMIESLRERATD
jgi:hypothetical protein